MPSPKETHIVESMGTKLAFQVGLPVSDVIQVGWLVFHELLLQYDKDSPEPWVRFMVKNIRRRTINHLKSTRQLRRYDRGSIAEITTSWPTTTEGEPLDLPDHSADLETLDETLEDISTLTMRERAVITWRYIRGESRDNVKKRMCLTEHDLNVLLGSARIKIKEALVV